MAVGGGSGGPKADINMTPMIDVLLVLIIIFMVITPLTPKGLEAIRAAAGPAQSAANRSRSAHHRRRYRQRQIDEDQPRSPLTKPSSGPAWKRSSKHAPNA
jgi:biopolymer transport protein ExbD